MAYAFKLRNYPITKLRNSCRGYILITLMLFVSLLAIAALAMAPAIAHQIQRDNEEEMMHRAVQYARGVRKFYKKFGRYPTRVEELENTNNMRFLRKRYKDPITGKDFKLLHMQDVTLNNGPQLPGQTGLVGAAGGGFRQAGPGEQNLPQVTGLPGQSNAGGKPAGGGDEDSDESPSTQQVNQSGPLGGSGSGLGGQTFGGGPILGVSSASKAQSIRICNKKDHYNDWYFIYDPQSDRGGLLNTCWQQNTGQVQGLGGQPGGLQGIQPNQGPGIQPQPQPQPQPQAPPQPNPNPEPLPPDQ
jgi:type II secretory pathway pseudopilin PulG